MFVGRDAESAALRGWLDELAAGRGRAVLIEGEPGVGKTALLRVALDHGSALGCQVFWADSDELGQRLPLRPFLAALGVHEGATDPGRAAIAELLRTPESGAAAASAVGWSDPVLAAAERLLALVDDLCASAPVALAVDDLQWADPVTVQVWSQLARAAQQQPLLIVGTRRPVPHRDDLDALRRGLGEHVVELGPLPEPDVTRLVAALAGGEPGPTLRRLAAGAAGNPLYLTELLGAINREGRLSRSGEVAEVVGGVPSSLAGAIGNRIVFLAAATRETLRTAALLGTRFTASDLASVTGRSVVALVEPLLEAFTAGVLADAGVTLSFRHALIRDALYAEIPATERPARHREAAHRLAASGVAADGVARHLLHAGDEVDDWSRDWLASAAPALINQAPTVAVELLQRTLDGTPVGHDRWGVLGAALARALLAAGRLADAEAQARAAIEVGTDPELLAELHWIVVGCLRDSSRWDDVRAVTNRVLDAPWLGQRWAARFLTQSAAVATLSQMADQRAAVEAVDRALAAAEAVGDRLALAWAQHAASIYHGLRGEEVVALAHMQRALDALGHDPSMVGFRLLVLRNVAIELAALDRLDEARHAARECRRLADGVGPRQLADARSALVDVEYYSGRWDDAIAEIDLDGERSVAGSEMVVCGIAALVALHRDEPATVEAWLRKADPLVERVHLGLAGYAVLARALATERDGRAEQALAALVGYLDSQPEIGLDYCGWDAVRLAVAVADVPTARRLTDQVECYATASDTASRRGMARYCRGLLDASAAPLFEAADLYRGVGRPLLLGMALEAAGGLLAEQGDVPRAGRTFRKAIDTYAGLSAAADVARVERRLREFGMRRGPRAVRQPVSGVAGLTRTERTVAHLVAEGLPNPEIADRLFLSRRTVEGHVSRILGKLRLASRVQVGRALTSSSAPAARA